MSLDDVYTVEELVEYIKWSIQTPGTPFDSFIMTEDEYIEMWKNADDDFHSVESENVDRIIKEMTNPVKEVENHDSN